MRFMKDDRHSWSRQDADVLRQSVLDVTGRQWASLVKERADARVAEWSSGKRQWFPVVRWVDVAKGCAARGLVVSGNQCLRRLNVEVEWEIFGRDASSRERLAMRDGMRSGVRRDAPVAHTEAKAGTAASLDDSLRSRREEERARRDEAIEDAERLERQAASADSDIAAARADADRRVAEIIRLASEAEHQAKDRRARAAACTARIEAIDLLIGPGEAPLVVAALAPELPRSAFAEAASAVLASHVTAQVADAARMPTSVWLADFLARHPDRHFTTDQIAHEAFKQGAASSPSDASARVVQALKKCHKAGIISRRDSGRGPTWRICKGQSGATVAVVG